MALFSLRSAAPSSRPSAEHFGIPTVADLSPVRHVSCVRARGAVRTLTAMADTKSSTTGEEIAKKSDTATVPVEQAVVATPALVQVAPAAEVEHAPAPDEQRLSSDAMTDTELDKQLGAVRQQLLDHHLELAQVAWGQSSDSIAVSNIQAAALREHERLLVDEKERRQRRSDKSFQRRLALTTLVLTSVAVFSGVVSMVTARAKYALDVEAAQGNDTAKLIIREPSDAASGHPYVGIVNDSPVPLTGVRVVANEIYYSPKSDCVMGGVGRAHSRPDAVLPDLGPYASARADLLVEPRPDLLTRKTLGFGCFSQHADGTAAGGGSAICDEQNPCKQIVRVRVAGRHSKLQRETATFEEFFVVNTDGKLVPSRSFGWVDELGEFRFQSDADHAMFTKVDAWLRWLDRHSEPRGAGEDADAFGGVGLTRAVNASTK